MRIMIKGGVWKNTEDEILKAAVMKYGKNQWARVASLLNRKTAKQCKARWYEWLDPSIKKTEWTRDEEEKLLHLAKLYPCQWRTVAPLVGRTAAQCMERYERLLDEAQREVAGGEGDGRVASAEEVRRLRPGEIDPTPETRPARPDPVDMDEDEKEMLSEARARLANTRGKKAKRKSRELQLDEARRLASLQKRRELKAAGIFSGSRFGRRAGGKFMDYDAEVPFQKLAPAGFYDVANEKRGDMIVQRNRDDADFEAIRLDRFEEQRRDAAEKIARRDDVKKKAKLMKANLPLAVEQLQRLNDPLAQLRRSQLALPQPQVTDEELEEIARLGAAAAALSDGGATSALLDGEDSGRSAVERALAASARQRTPAPHDDLLQQEAMNQILERQMQTPLLGEEQPEKFEGTGYGGATPRSTRAQTPSALSLRGGDTPLSGAASGRTPGRGGARATPLRDALGLNDAGENGSHRGDSRGDGDSRNGESFDDDESTFGAASSRGGQSRGASQGPSKRARLELQRGLEGLPEPKYAYEMEAPAHAADDAARDDAKASTTRSVRDAANVDAARLAAVALAERERLARRSAAVIRALPRPRAVPGAVSAAAGEGDAHMAEQMIRDELALLVRRDAFEHAVKGAAPYTGGAAALHHVDDAEVAAARRLVDAEAASVLPADDEDAFADAWRAAFADAVFFPAAGGGRWGALSAAPPPAAVVAAYRADFEATRSQMAKGALRAARLEERVEQRLGPLVARADELRGDVAECVAQLDAAAIEAACFARLRNVERVALPKRLDAAKRAVHAAALREKALQAEFFQLKDDFGKRYALAAQAANAQA
ncbi:pre-mRNA splicing factor component-domain-containing protein [Pelagophyceae sp. CCMP2097]|nr:pre-mRNA splicing factor component-domain-containing protein [Pelagophyceae sp. CCMP2097]